MKHSHSRALVTGGAGFIGSHIVDRLLKEDFHVTVIDDLSTGRLENIKAHLNSRNLLFMRGDIRDVESVKKALRDAEVVFHEAAFVGGPQSVDKPLVANSINIDGTLNLLEASRKSEVERFVLASSAAVYGEQETVPISEDAILHPSSPYAVSKRATELYAEFYYKTFGLETVCLRYFNVYGPRQALGPYAAAIMGFVDYLMHDKPPVIYGDGEQTRDFINIKDVVEVNVLAVDRKCAGEILNVTTGVQMTINKLLKVMQTVMGKKHIKPIYADKRQSDIYHSCGDTAKARKILDFRPRVSIRQGLMEFVEFCKSSSLDA